MDERKVLPLSKLYINKKTQREDDGNLDELADSLEKMGPINPIIVVKDEEGYMILAGQRRYKALKAKKISEVECVIKKDLTSEQQIDITWHENIGRKEMNWHERAKIFIEGANTHLQQNILKLKEKEHPELPEAIEKLVTKTGFSESQINNYIKACIYVNEFPALKSESSFRAAEDKYKSLQESPDEVVENVKSGKQTAAKAEKAHTKSLAKAAIESADIVVEEIKKDKENLVKENKKLKEQLSAITPVSDDDDEEISSGLRKIKERKTDEDKELIIEMKKAIESETDFLELCKQMIHSDEEDKNAFLLAICELISEKKLGSSLWV